MMSSTPTVIEKQESIEVWSKRLRSAPYPGGTIGYVALEFLATASWWTVLLISPVMIWIELRASARSKAKALHVS